MGLNRMEAVMNTRFLIALSTLVVACSATTPEAATDKPSSKGDTNGDPAGTATPAKAAPAAPTTGTPAPAGAVRLNADQKLRADRLTSVFENGTIDLQYDYVEDIQDGRGYTCGRGFTTATGDAARVVEEYVKNAPNDPLAQLIPTLKQLALDGSGSTTGLTAFPAAWQAAAKTPAMHTAEDNEVDRASYTPAAGFFDGVGAQMPLTLAVLYDSVFMHGDGDDPDGVPALMTTATKNAGGTPKTGIDEHVWLAAFIAARRADLANANDPASRMAWAEAVGRADALKDLLDVGNIDLHGPITVGHGYDVTVP
jgi:chitosanase